MCNRARMKGEIETIWGSVAELFSERPRDNRFDPQELRPKGRAYVIREQDGVRAWDIMNWDVLGGKAPYPMRIPTIARRHSDLMPRSVPI
ncbi:hypothetical protein BES08_28645 (plasmid) [Novosphingobium resinovorum]|uniref:DUF159 family protein n=1 Tax=Novosphingobium resinovorum TaxID=158500 RepID=A0A1D8AF76_9SPHN|nr:hypothetical protein BES08_28645 [Novosphingobium resinovorum]